MSTRSKRLTRSKSESSASQNSYPKSREELFQRVATDPVFFLETFCKVISPDKGLVRFRLNNAQRRYVDEIWNQRIGHDVVGKCRKWGFSTERVGLGLHQTIFTPGWTFRIIAHRQRTADELNKTVKTLYETAVETFREIGEDPDYYLVRPTGDRATGYEFGSIRSAIHVDTASAKGVGQSDRNDDIYATEYSDWEHAENAFSGLAGSQPPGSKRTRFTIDFNAHGTGSDAYLKYTRAKLPHDDPNWNGFTAFFAGILDVPEWYTPEDMEIARLQHGKKFVEVYPSNDEEMWLANELAVFDADQVKDAKGRSGGAYCGEDAECYVHGVDPASGVPGLDYQACVTLGFVDGIWTEAAPPIHGHWPEDVFAEMVHERTKEFPGVCVVERNVGSATLVKLRELSTQGLYRHRSRDKTGKQVLQLGFPTTYGTKKILASETQRMLRDGELGIVTEGVYNEMRDLQWKVKELDGSRIEEVTDLWGAPERSGSHDDLAIAYMLALQGAEQALNAPRIQFRS